MPAEDAPIVAESLQGAGPPAERRLHLVEPLPIEAPADMADPAKRLDSIIDNIQKISPDTVTEGERSTDTASNLGVEITQENYKNYVDGTNWTDNMQPLTYEDWAKWQESLGGAEPNAEEPEIDPRDKKIAELEEKLSQLEQQQRQEREEADRRHQELLDKIQELVDQLAGRVPPPLPPPPSPLPPPLGEGDDTPTPREQLIAAETAARETMETSRNELADITIRRRGRMDDRWRAHRREDLELYNTAMEAYRENVAEYLRAHAAVMETSDPASPEAASPSEVEIQRELLTLRYAEQREFKKAEGERNEVLYEAVVAAGGMKARYARLLRWWSNQSTGKKILVGLGVGGLAFLATGPLGLGAAAVAGGSAAKFSLGVLNRSASARNRSPQSVEREIGRITRDEERSLLHFDEEATAAATAGLTLGRESHIAGQTGGLESDLNRDVVRAQRRNRIGNALMVAGAGAAALGAANTLMDHWPFGLSGGGGGGNSVDMSNFHPDSFQGGGTGVKTLEHAFGIFERNNIQVHGLTPERLAAINQDLVARHFPMASGMGPDGLQNIVDWTAGSAPNINASNLEGLAKVDGSSVGSWIELKNIAESHGVTFTPKP